MDAAQATSLLGWGEIAKIVLASGVVATLIGVFKDYVFKVREREIDARFAAIGLIARLDLYALQSRNNLWTYEEVTAGLNPHAHYQSWPRCPYPELEIPSDALRYLSKEHASDLAWISTDRAIAAQHLSVVAEASFDPTEVRAHEAELVGYFGYEAFLLAYKLRTHYGLPPFGQRWGLTDDFSDLRRAWKATRAQVKKLAQPIKVTDI